jgi:Peptidase family M23
MRVRLAALSALLVLAVPPAASGWTWPVDGPVLRPFSFGSDPYAAGQHRGIDIGAASGTPVRAAAGGVVSFAGTVPNGGKTVTIQTSTGYAVTLVHLGSIRVLRGTAIEEGATVGTVGPSGVPDIPQPYVYLGIRVASDDQGYLDPLLFLPPRAEPSPASESAADPPSAPAGESPGGEVSTPPVATEPPPAPPADATEAPPPETSESPGTTPEPAAEPAPIAGAEQPPATVPVTGAEPAAAAPSVAPASSTDGSSETAPAAQVQGPAGGRAMLPAEEPVAALGGSARAGASPSAVAARATPGAAPAVTVEPVEHHAVPAEATQPGPVHGAAATESDQQGAVVQLPLARGSQRHRARATAVLGADATQRGGSHSRAGTRTRSLDDLWIAAALATALAAALAIQRRRRRPGATPAGTETPRMMVLVGGLQHEADARRVDRPTPVEQDERLAA